jgi:hypothetical protein
METTLENRKKATTNFPRSVLKMNNIVEEGGALGSRVKKEKESIDLKENDEGHSGITCSTISGQVSATNGTSN